jgi:thymidylate synthase
MTLPPCHYGFQVYTRELSYNEKVHEARKRFGFESEDGTRTFDINSKESIEFLTSSQRAISLMWNQRSVDTFLGLPFNIASYALLLEIIAKVVNMVPDELIGTLGDCHLYKNHIEQAKEQLTREPRTLPQLKPQDWSNIKGESYEMLDIGKFKSLIPTVLWKNILLEGYNPHPTIKAPLNN